MKAIVQGEQLARALQQIHQAVPHADRLILHANGSLELIGLDSTNFGGKRVRIAEDAGYTNIKDGTASIPFEQLWQLSRMAEFRTAELHLQLDPSKRLHLETIYKQQCRHNGRKYTDTIAAEYSLEETPIGMDLDRLREGIDRMETAAAEEAAATVAPETAAPACIPTKSVTIPSVYLKALLPRATKHGRATIASRSDGVYLLTGGADVRACQFVATAQADRFYVHVPVTLLRAAVTAGDTVTIGYLRTDIQWKDLADTHVHPRKYDWLAIQPARPRRSFTFEERRIGTVNGIPFREEQRYQERHERTEATCVPKHYGIAYRDERTGKGGENIVGEWHFIREVRMPEAFATMTVAKLQPDCPRKLEHVWLESDATIAIEETVSAHTQWKILRVFRRQYSSRRWTHRGRMSRNYCDDGYWNVLATIEHTTHGRPCSGKEQVHLGGFPSDLAKALTLPANYDLAARLLNEPGAFGISDLEQALEERARPKSVAAVHPLPPAIGERISYRVEEVLTLEMD